jgi:hypothetical protein
LIDFQKLDNPEIENRFEQYVIEHKENDKWTNKKAMQKIDSLEDL